MGEIINTIISNDLLFYGIIVFLIVGIILLFVYLHHKKFITVLENEVEFQKVEEPEQTENENNVSVNETTKISLDKELQDKISELDGKMAMSKILNDDEPVDIKINEPEEKPFIKSNSSKTSCVEENKSITKSNDDISEISPSPKSELELVLEKMQHDLEEQKDKDAVAIFEQEQEEKSIISYKELLQRKNELTTPEVLHDERFENEPTMIEDNDNSLTDDYINLVDNVNDIISVDSIKEANDIKQTKKFVTTDFISPVFGRRQAEFDYPKVPNFKDMMIKKEKTSEYDLETTLNLDPLTDQIKRDDAFLSALKEFRKNLE